MADCERVVYLEEQLRETEERQEDPNGVLWRALLPHIEKHLDTLVEKWVVAVTEEHVDSWFSRGLIRRKILGQDASDEV